ncbi:hypothetical protein HAPAU_30470 [Halalkalicoccus paucihalophilus]|uniref:Sodium/phosphate symporter n=1 Tax=Halalkalicoccus paucihalophilus TaxID=1008153 RepID=A0A151ABE0_9EURY|nr:sodium/phosphate symporter [Halalkalicoccus paucihalophilus]KYH24955.1 hypothetical protein HAPAU_30470 [Halalkalicoccus paucihalophilus]
MTESRDVRRYVLAVLCVFAIGVAIRLAPLYWTPYPFNPDGFGFASVARTALESGSIPSANEHRMMGSQRYIFVSLLVLLSRITSLQPLWLAQPAIAVIGTIPALIVVLVVREIGIELGWPSRRTFIAATLAGVVLATEGLYLRRSVAVSYEVLGLLFIPAIALCLHRFFATSRRSWLGIAGILLLVLPATHHFSTVVAGVTLVVLVGIWIDRQPTLRIIATGVAITVGFWAYLLLYYSQSPPPYTGLITTNPMLFIAWIIAIVTLAYWFRMAQPSLTRGVFASIGLLGFGVLALNAVQPFFPSMSSTPLLLLVLVAPLIVLVVLMSWGLPIVVRLHYGPLVLALLIAPLTFIALSLTAGLSPQYFHLIQRTQTFVHLSAVIIAVVATFVLYDRVQDRSQSLRTIVQIGLPIILILVAVVTVPIAFVGLEAVSYQGTTTEAEFSTVTFASTMFSEPWTSDDHITRVENNYYGSEHNAGPEPVYNWLHGGTPPTCSTIAEDSWTTVGAQLFPASPEQLSDERYANWQAENNIVYVSGAGGDRQVIVTPTGGSTASC